MTKKQKSNVPVDENPKLNAPGFDAAVGERPDPLADSVFSWDDFDEEEFESDDLRALNLPAFLKMADMPVGKGLKFELRDVLPSPRPSIINPVALIRLPNGQEYTLGISAVIARALMPTYDRKNADHNANPREHCPYIGSTVYLRKESVGTSREFTDDSNKPRKFPIYRVKIKESDD